MSVPAASARLPVWLPSVSFDSSKPPFGSEIQRVQWSAWPETLRLGRGSYAPWGTCLSQPPAQA